MGRRGEEEKRRRGDGGKRRRGEEEMGRRGEEEKRGKRGRGFSRLFPRQLTTDN
jgi:hypothetical protein